MKNDNYLGNRNLKKSYVHIEWDAHMVQEYVKCARDAVYFIEKYVKIIHVDRGLIPFKPYDFQKDIVRTAEENRYLICKMPRQSGKTTTIGGLILHRVLFNENYSVAVLAHKAEQAIEILSRIQLAYENLPRWLQQGIVEWNKKSIVLENGSVISASSTASNAIRGTSQNLVYLDEFAFVPNHIQQEFFASVYPTISSGTTTKVMVTSTPNGLNMFYKIWKDSEDARNDYKRIDVHWSQVPGRDEKWKEETIRNTSIEQFQEEFECEFLGSSSTLISGAKLKQLTYSNPLKRNENLFVYEEPKKDHVYFLVVDTARGKEGDYSAFKVFDATTLPYKDVAVYRDNLIDPVIYPNMIVPVAKHYNNAYVLVEVNDIGQQVADILYQELEYENMLFTAGTNIDGIIISAGFGTSSHPGVRTTKTIKKLGCSNLKSLIENDQLFLNNYDTLQELYRFIQKGVSYEAEEGNDDLVMCCVLFAWMTSQSYFKELTNIDFRKQLETDNESRMEENLLPFGIKDDGNYQKLNFDDEIKVVELEDMSFEQWMTN